MSSVGHGGGFLRWLAGIAAAVISGVLVVVLTEGRPKPDLDPGSSRSIDFAITDQLGPGQFSERISVMVNGRSVGTLTVDTVHRNDTITVTLPRPGRYDYRLEGSLVITDGYGGSLPVTGYGTGTIEAGNGLSFAVMGDFSTNPIRLSLG